MTNKNTLEKAYGHIPRDVGFNIDITWVPTPRGIKYYWLRLVRLVTR